MTDTPRTQAELLSIFGDGQTGGITAQDMRDFVVSAGVVFQARLSSAQSIPSDTSPHPVAFNSIVYDPFGFWDGTWPIVPADMGGSYLIACSFAFAANGTGARVVDIGTDSSADPDGGQWCVSAAPAPFVTAQTGAWVSRGNEAGFGFYTQCTQNSSGALNLNYCTLTLSRLLA